LGIVAVLATIAKLAASESSLPISTGLLS
jgi:hypothetical protein